MSDDVMPCEHGSYGLCPQCVREERDRLRAELAGKEKALSAAKTVIEAKDKAYALIDQRFAAMSAKAATTDSERECNERLTAEIDALTAELAEARRLLDEARKQEPVGFVDSLVGSVFVTGDECDLYKTELMTPVYAAPVPAQPAALDIPAFLRRDPPETGKLPCKHCGTGYVPAQPASLSETFIKDVGNES